MASSTGAWALGVMDSPAGGQLPCQITPVGGLVIDLVGFNGTRIVSEIAAGNLYSGTTKGNTTYTIGSMAGFSTSLINSLGGGLASASLRLTMGDGDNALGEDWYDAEILFANGVSFGTFSSVSTIEADTYGNVLTTNTNGGFRGGSIDTGFFSLSGTAQKVALAALYSTLSSGTMTITFSEKWGGNVTSFKMNVPDDYASVSVAPMIVSYPLVNPIQNAYPVLTPMTSTFVVSGQTFTLSATSNNTVAGLEFVPGSSLAISNTLTVTSGSIHTQAGAASTITGGELSTSGGFQFNTEGDQTVSSVLKGTGGLAKTGSATLTLTADNSLAGDVTVSQGTLKIGSGSAGSMSGASSFNVAADAVLTFATGNQTISVPITNNGTFQSAGTGVLSISGVISGSGGFAQIGTGITILSAPNTYTGATTVSNGALVIDSTGDISSSSGISVQSSGTLALISPSGMNSTDIANDGQLIFAPDNTLLDYNYHGSISGSGSLVKTGANWLWMDGTHTYTGETRIEDGVLVAGQNTLPFNSTIEISGSASLCLLGSGTIGTLSGAGEVYLGDDVVISTGGDNANKTFSGFLGTGTSTRLEKIGTGVWTVSGTATVDGTTQVSSGGLVVNGLVQSNVLVQGGFLGGSGVIQGNVINQAIVSPGNSPWTLTIAGNYTQESTGVLTIQIASPTSYDKLVVTGTAILSGTLQIAPTNYNLRGTTFTIVSADDVVGAFTNISSATALRLNVRQVGTEITLESTLKYFATTPGLTGNPLAVAKGLDGEIDTAGFYGNPAMLNLVDYLATLTPTDLAAAFELIAPTDYILLPDVTFAQAQVQASNLERRMEEIRSSLDTWTCQVNTPNTFYNSNSSTDRNGMRYLNPQGRELTPAPIDRQLGFFLNGSMDYVTEKVSSVYSDGKFTTGGVSAGADYRFNDNFAAGLTVGYANTSTQGRGDGNVDIDGGDLTAYATLFNEGFFGNLIVGGGSSDYSVRRDTLGGVAHGNASGSNFQTLLGGGYSYRSEGLTFGPVASLRYAKVNIGGFTEKGTIAPLDIDSQDKDSIKSTLGFQVAYEFPVGDTIFKPQAKVQWRHEFANDSRDVTASFKDGGQFTVNGPGVGKDGILLETGLTVRVTPAVSVYGLYSGDLGVSNYTANAFMGGLELSF